MRIQGIVVGALCLCARLGVADGCFVWRDREADIREPQQKALVYHAGGEEVLVLEVRFEGAVEDFGWLVPLPARPAVEKDTPLLFEFLSKATQEPVHGVALRDATANLAGEGGDAVAVLEEKRVGVFDTAVLKAGAGEALASWLRRHGYTVGERGRPILERYVRRGWVFVAMRITPQARQEGTRRALRDGTLQPVRFRFPAAEPVFPLEISALGGHPSTVLLYVVAPDVLVPAGPAGVTWETRVFSDPAFAKRLEGHLRRASWNGVSLDDVSDSALGLLLARPGLCVGKYRARFSASEMRDVTFGPYRPAAALRGEDPDSRLEALTYLGFHGVGSDESRELVADVLGADDLTERTLAVWALGRVGGGAALDDLLECADDPDRMVVCEALDALRTRACGKVVRKLLEILRREGPGAANPKGGWPGARFVQEKAFDVLLDTLSDADLEMLRGFARENGAEERWRELGAGERRARCYSDPEFPGVLVVPLLSVVGDRDADAILARAVVAGSRRAEHSLLSEDAKRTGSLNSFPSGFWIGGSIIDQVSSYWWPALRTVMDLFESAPEVRDRILRAALKAPEVPDAAAVVLVSWMDSAADAELERLREIWERSLSGEPLRIHASDERIGKYPAVPYNYRASAISYALHRLGRPEILVEWSRDVPADDWVTRGDVAWALAKSRHPRGLEYVLAFVKDHWNRTVQEDRFQTHVNSMIEDLSDFRAEMHEGGYLRGFWGLDLQYHVFEVEQYLLNELGARGRLEELTHDPEMHLYFRLHWMLEIAGDLFSLEDVPDEYAAPFAEERRALSDLLRECEKPLEAELEALETPVETDGQIVSSVLRVIRAILAREGEKSHPSGARRPSATRPLEEG